jgi:hypothetical protein
MAAVRVLLGREVLIAAGYLSDGDLPGGLHRHDEQVARLDTAAQHPQLTCVVGDQRIRARIGVGNDLDDLVSRGDVSEVGDFRPAISRAPVLQRPRIPLPVPAGSDHPSHRHAAKVKVPPNTALQNLLEAPAGRPEMLAAEEAADAATLSSPADRSWPATQIQACPEHCGTPTAAQALGHPALPMSGLAALGWRPRDWLAGIW